MMDKAQITKEICDLMKTQIYLDWQYVDDPFIMGYSDAADVIMEFLDPFLNVSE